MSVNLDQRNIITPEWLSESLEREGYSVDYDDSEGLLIPLPCSGRERLCFGGIGWLIEGADNEVYLCAITSKSLAAYRAQET